MALLGGLAISATGADISLKGTWKATFAEASYCDKAAPLLVEQTSFEIQDAPYFNRAASSFKYSDANVIGTVSVQLHMEHQRYPERIIFGLLVGELVSTEKGVTLEGYIVSKEQYGAWLANNKQGQAPSDAGEVELEVSGNALQGYTLAGMLRSGEVCGRLADLDLFRRGFVGNFGKKVPSKWSAHVTLKKQ
jgi:hypothetical protein